MVVDARRRLCEWLRDTGVAVEESKAMVAGGEACITGADVQQPGPNAGSHPHITRKASPCKQIAAPGATFCFIAQPPPDDPAHPCSPDQAPVASMDQRPLC